MSLAFRFARAVGLFMLIFTSYIVQIGMARVLRRKAVKDGHERWRVPAWLKRRRERIDVRNARRLLRGMLRLRGVFIKLGQVLSIMGGFLPRAYTTELESCRTRCRRILSRTSRRAFAGQLRQGPGGVLRASSGSPSPRRRSARCTSPHLAGRHEGGGEDPLPAHPRDDSRGHARPRDGSSRSTSASSRSANIESVHRSSSTCSGARPTTSTRPSAWSGWRRTSPASRTSSSPRSFTS